MKTTLNKKIKLPEALPHLISSATDIFTGWIDSDFKNYGLTSDSSADENTMEVYDLKENGTFKEIFESFGKSLDCLVVTQGQVIEFAKTLKNDDKYDYFFLLKKENEFFVACVFFDSGGHLEVDLYRLSRDFVWGAGCRHRLVVPQLTTLKPSPLSSDSLTPCPSDSLEVMIEKVKKAGYQVSKIL